MTYTMKPGLMKAEEIIADHWMTSLENMRSRSKLREHVEARQVAIWYYLKYKHATLGQAARLMNRDHATANYARMHVENLMATDKLFRKRVDAVLIRINKIDPLDPVE